MDLFYLFFLKEVAHSPSALLQLIVLSVITGEVEKKIIRSKEDELPSITFRVFQKGNIRRNAEVKSFLFLQWEKKKKKMVHDRV